MEKKQRQQGAGRKTGLPWDSKTDLQTEPIPIIKSESYLQIRFVLQLVNSQTKWNRKMHFHSPNEGTDPILLLIPLKISVRFFISCRLSIKHILPSALLAKQKEFGQSHCPPFLTTNRVWTSTGLMAQDSVQQLEGGAENKLRSCLLPTFLQILRSPVAKFNRAASQATAHCAAHSAKVRKCLIKWDANRIRLDKGRIRQLAVIRYCLRCKLMLS